MGRKLDNYYLILELDFMKPEADADVIERRIQEKAKFWTANSDKGRMQTKYRQYKDQVMDIGKVMTTDSLRIAEAKDAETFVKGILKDELRFFPDAKEIPETAANLIMRACGLWPEMFTKITGIKIVKDSAAEEQKISDPNPKPDKFAKFQNYDSNLNVLQKKNLYDFLADDAAIDIIGLQTLDGEELIKNYSNPLKERVRYDKSENATATRTLCAACEEVFNPASSDLRKNYDKYLIWQKKADVITRMDKYSGASKVLNEQRQKLFIDELTQILRNRDDAIKIYDQICAFKGIKSLGGTLSKSNDQKLLACGHCYTMVDISHGERKCSSCGKDLYIKCPNPNCKQEIPASLSACGYCGFKLDDLQKVETLCQSAKSLLENMDFDKARSNLAKAEMLLAGYEKIGLLKQELEERESAFSEEIEKLNSFVAQKAFYKASDALRNLQKKVPTAKIANDVLIETSVAEAERLYKSAVLETSEDKLISICSQIVNVCSDYPGVEALLVKYRPKAPNELKIIPDTVACSNMITWGKSVSTGEISYKVLRKTNTAAASIDDPEAELLGIAGTTKFVDTTIIPGVDYYYSVYAIRAGVASNPVCANAVNAAEVQIIHKEEGDSYIKVEWQAMGRNATVEVYRGENEVPLKSDDGKRIIVSNNSFTDDTVDNDKTYYYLIIVSYRVAGKDLISKTKLGPMIPTALPEPIENMTVSDLGDDVFEAKWVPHGSERVNLYYTDKRTSLKYGDITRIEKVKETLKAVDSLSFTSNSCRFRIHDINKKYLIIPVTVKHSIAVIGEQAIAAKIEKLTVLSTELISNDLKVNIKWPEDAVSILILYGIDGYAKSIDDRKGKTVRNVSKKQFDLDTGLFIRNVGQYDYYITLYSACRVNGETVYSDGTQVMFDNSPKPDILYGIHVKGIVNKQIEIEFHSEKSEFFLPAIDIIAKQGAVPVYNTSGMVVEHIEEQKVSGSLKLVLPINSVPRNSYIKPFFADVDMSDEVNLRPTYGTKFKVN